MPDSYREKIYTDYGTKFQKAENDNSIARMKRWGRSYLWHFRSWLPDSKQSAIVDLACGFGKFLQLLKDAGYVNVTGVDLSHDQVELARKVQDNVIEMDILEFLAEHKETFDLIVAMDIIEHFKKDEVLNVLSRLNQSLKNGGRIILQTPNAESPWSGHYRYGDFTHEISFTPSLLRHLLELNGFSEIEFREFSPVPFGNGPVSSIRYVLWRMVAMILWLWNMIELGNAGSGIYTRSMVCRAKKIDSTNTSSRNLE